MRGTIGPTASISFLLYLPAVHFLTGSQMSSEATRQAPMMPLRQLVDRYRVLAGEFGRPVSLSAFHLGPLETERLFSSYDEDYHISRFFHFIEGDGEKFSINGIPATHVSLDAEIQTIL